MWRFVGKNKSVTRESEGKRKNEKEAEIVVKAQSLGFTNRRVNVISGVFLENCSI